eukprot:TRINITY_DN66222_c3_g1_i3.p1 TRINITY_DN66222_c3_g1~~TRINITY_DN66222_c3_g1_i3.p1  ORF type:complete len:471 (-),score=42.58 TRINITY_DN66222_c3_g1_i3:82-1494(-)
MWGLNWRVFGCLLVSVLVVYVYLNRGSRTLATVHPPIRLLLSLSTNGTALTRGGLGNSVHVLNTMLDFALRRYHGVVLPPIQPTHRAQQEFLNMFQCDHGYSLVAANRWKTSFVSSNKTYLVVHGLCKDGVVEIRAKPHGHLNMSCSGAKFELQLPPSMPTNLTRELTELYQTGTMHGSEKKLHSWICKFQQQQQQQHESSTPHSCTQTVILVLLPAEDVAINAAPDARSGARKPHKNYQATAPLLRRWYHKQHPFPYKYKTKACSPQQNGGSEFVEHAGPYSGVPLGNLLHPDFGKYKLTVCLHIRQGHKTLPVKYWLALLHVLHKVIPPPCVSMALVSERVDHPDVAKLQQHYPNITVIRHQKDTQPEAPGTGAFVDFHTMVSSDILLAGVSSFSRVAAVVSNGVAVVPARGDFPLTSFPNVVTCNLTKTKEPQQLKGVQQKLTSVLHDNFGSVLGSCKRFLANQSER